MDYEQELITTIHDLSYQPDRLEQRLTELSQTHPTAVLIPSLYEELGRPALGVIRDHLSHCPFVNNVIVCLYADTFEQYRHAVQFFEPLPQPTFVLWENGPGITGILQTLQDIAVPERMRYTSTERSLGTHRLGQLTCTSSE